MFNQPAGGNIAAQRIAPESKSRFFVKKLKAADAGMVTAGECQALAETVCLPEFIVS